MSPVLQTKTRPGGTALRSIPERVLRILAEVTGVDEVRQLEDLLLYEQHILDSLGTVSLIVAFSEEFGVEIPPSEVDQEQWATPAKILAFIETRLGA